MTRTQSDQDDFMRKLSPANHKSLGQEATGRHRLAGLVPTDAAEGHAELVV